jgi:hypothetical protein
MTQNETILRTYVTASEGLDRAIRLGDRTAWVQAEVHWADAAEDYIHDLESNGFTAPVGLPEQVVSVRAWIDALPSS